MEHRPKQSNRPSLLRHLAVMFYDGLILLSILFFASFIAVVINDGQAINQGNLFFMFYLIAVSFLFYGWFWTHGGQTVGMKAWKVYLISEQRHSISWQQAFLRFIAALFSWLSFGLGWCWQWFDHNNKNWPDKFSNTYLQYNENID